VNGDKGQVKKAAWNRMQKKEVVTADKVKVKV